MPRDAASRPERPVAHNVHSAVISADQPIINSYTQIGGIMTPEDAVEALKLDESRFTGEGADLTLLHSLRKAEQAIEVASPVSE